MNHLDEKLKAYGTGMATSYLSELTGIPKQTLDAYRQNRRQMDLVNGLKISYALGINPYDLTDDWKIVKELRDK